MVIKKNKRRSKMRQLIFRDHEQIVLFINVLKIHKIDM